jgi:phosphoribosyl 1,2-cyclic phosphodiesterase
VLRVRSLASGSAGNATLVHVVWQHRHTHVLIDCGPGLRDITQRLAEVGLDAAQLDALFITHEHADHAGSAIQLAKRDNLPLITSYGTWQAMGAPESLAPRWASDGQAIDLGDVTLRPFTVPHDAREPLQLRIESPTAHLGLLTDLGHVSSHVEQALQGVTALLIECNHCPTLLAQSRYPATLKRRIGGDWGHLSNKQAADLVRRLSHASLTRVIAAHLSEENNRPELAQQALAEALGWPMSRINVATQANGSDWFEVAPNPTLAAIPTSPAPPTT